MTYRKVVLEIVRTCFLSEIELFTVGYRYRSTWFPLPAFEFGLLGFDASVMFSSYNMSCSFLIENICQDL